MIAAAQEKPFTMGQLLRAISTVNEKTGPEKAKLLRRIAADVKARGVDFPLTKDYEKLLRDEGANNQLIDAIRRKAAETTPTPDGGKAFKNSIGMEFIRIPSGTFTMGSAANKDEQPVHRATVSKAFYIGKYEVTIGEWKKVMGDSANPIADEDKMFYEKDRQPIIYVSWGDVQEFIKRLSTQDGGAYRLPTEAEWEYVARAGTKTQWFFGSDFGKIGTYAWIGSNSGGKTHEVGKKEPNGFGVYDIYGNVSEWVHDRYAPYPSDAVTDSFGSKTGDDRVTRGGGWNITVLSSTYRGYAAPTYRKNNIGFRLVRVE